MKLLSTFIKDLTLSFRSFYIYIEIIMAVIFVAVLLFAVPEEFKSENKVYLSIDLPDAAKANLLDELAGDGAVSLVADEAAVRSALETDRAAAGLVISMKEGKIDYHFILQGYESEKVINILRQSFLGEIAREVPGYQDNTTLTILDPDAQKLSDRINMLPLFLVLNSAFVGLFIIASYVFMDKEEGTIKAFAVTPCKVWQYLLSKVGVMIVAGLTTGLIMAAAVSGLHMKVLPFCLLLIVTNAFGSVLGLFIASFFDSITKAMGWLYSVIIVLSFTSVSYYMPSFSPIYIRILPSYPMLYAFRQVFLDRPDPTILYGTILLFAGLSVIIFLLANWRYKKTITI
jgi:ABC-type multidrug transport system permease subunit